MLSQRSFGLFFLGNLISNLGTWFHDIAAAILVFQLTGSATMVGGVAIASFGTSLVTAPLAGYLADRFDRRYLLALTQLVQASAAGGLAVWVAAGLTNPWVVLVLSAVIGLGRALTSTAQNALIPSVVERADLAPALALHAATYSVARALGPIVGALVVATLGVAMAFGVNAFSFVVYACILPFIRVTDRASNDPVQRGGFRAGLNYVLARPELLLLLGLVTVASAGSDPVVTLGPSFAALWGRGEPFVGYLVSAFGSGAIASAFSMAPMRSRVGPGSTGLAGMSVLAAGLFVLGLAPLAEVALLGAFVSGFGFMLGTSELTTTLQECVPDGVRGRVMALWTMGFFGSRPIAALLNGTLADLVSPRLSVAVLGSIILLATIVARARLKVPPAPPGGMAAHG